MAETKIKAETRTEFGKGAARRIRRSDKVPAVLYEHGSVPLHVTLPGHDLMMALKNANALLSINVEGKEHLVIPKQVQRDAIKGFIEHADLLMVKRGEKVVIDIGLHFTGEPAPGSLVQAEVNSISLEAEATNIPEGIEVSIEGLEPGVQIHAVDLVLPKGTTLETPEDWLIVHITAAPTAEEVESELAEAEAEAGIEHDTTDEEEVGAVTDEEAKAEDSPQE